MLNPEVAALDKVFRQQGLAAETTNNLYSEVLSPLLARASDSQAQILGILGLQGSGKTTLCSMLCELGALRGISIVSISIDDLYLSYAARKRLRHEDPRFVWRGPPGTHDVSAGIRVLSEFKSGAKTLRLPRFDKSLHRGQGDTLGFRQVARPDLVLFEGWFVGCRALPDDYDFSSCSFLDDPGFSAKVNQNLKQYHALWDLLDQFICYVPEDFGMSLAWRLEAEKHMRARTGSGMSEQEVAQFVNYFWQALHPEVYVRPLITPGAMKTGQDKIVPDCVIRLDRRREVSSVQWGLL